MHFKVIFFVLAIAIGVAHSELAAAMPANGPPNAIIPAVTNHPITHPPVTPPHVTPPKVTNPPVTKPPTQGPTAAVTPANPSSVSSKFDFVSNYDQLMEAAKTVEKNAQNKLNELKASQNFFAELLEDELKKLHPLIIKIEDEHKIKPDNDEMIQGFIPDMLKYLYRCSTLIKASQENSSNYDNLIIKINDVLKRSYGDLGKGEIIGRDMTTFRANIFKLKELAAELKLLKKQDFDKGKEFLKQIYEIEEALKKDIIEIEKSS